MRHSGIEMASAPKIQRPKTFRRNRVRGLIIRLYFILLVYPGLTVRRNY